MIPPRKGCPTPPTISPGTPRDPRPMELGPSELRLRPFASSSCIDEKMVAATSRDALERRRRSMMSPPLPFSSQEEGSSLVGTSMGLAAEKFIRRFSLSLSLSLNRPLRWVFPRIHTGELTMGNYYYVSLGKSLSMEV
jgi:hypothetical protein